MPAILQVAAAARRRSSSIPAWSRLALVTCTDGRSTASAVTRRPCPYRPNPHGPALGEGKSKGKWREILGVTRVGVETSRGSGARGEQGPRGGGNPLHGLAGGIGEGVPLAAFHIQGAHYRTRAGVEDWMMAFIGESALGVARPAGDR